MSQHWNILRQKTLSSQGQGVDDILAALEKTDPALAKQLRRLNWAVIRKEVAKRALASAAARLHGCVIKSSYENATSYYTASGDPPRGVCVDVLKMDDAQLGVAIEGTNLHLFWNVFAQEVHGDALRLMMQTLETAYQKEALRALLQLIGTGTPTEETTENGLVVLSTTLPEGV